MVDNDPESRTFILARVDTMTVKEIATRRGRNLFAQTQDVPFFRFTSFGHVPKPNGCASTKKHQVFRADSGIPALLSNLLK